MERRSIFLVKLIGIIMLLLTTKFANAQEIKISGKITTALSGEPLPGVNILIKGTSVGVVTDIEGNYSIAVPDKESVLVISFMGYITEEITVGDQTTIDLEMIEDIMSLDELVVIGYGTQRKGDVTSSIATVNSGDFVKGNRQDVGQLLQGKVSGLTVYSVSGDPTANMQIKLRGTNTLEGANSSPLILIDGVPGDFNSVAPEDVESIDVLKDGSAAAIYGTKGANGVIIITTKRASGRYTNKVTYSGYVSTSKIARQLNISTAADVRQQIADGYRAETYDGGATTDWMEEITRKPLTHSHNLSFNGGNDQTNYLFNINYRNAEGIFIKSNNKVTNAKMDINHQMFNGKLKLNFGGITRYINTNTTGDGYGFNGYVYRQAKIYNPTSPIKTEEGEWFENTGAFNYDNPVARLMEADGKNASNWSRVQSTITYEPIQGLKLKSLVSYSRYNQTRGYYETKSHISTKKSSLNGYASNGSSEATDRLLELTADYSKSLGDQRFTIMGGYSYEEHDGYGFWQRNVDFPTDRFGYYNIGLGNGLNDGHATTAMGSSRDLSNLIAFFGRATYSYADKYLFMGTLRYEAASTLFGADNPWGLFPAFSVGWRLSNESFMQNMSFINDLKLRAGYGVTGSQPLQPFLAVSTLSYDEGVFYLDGKWSQTLEPYRNPNPFLRWEERRETNIGLDYTILDNRISGAIDLYKRKTDGLLFDYQVPKPPNLVDFTRANVGEMENKGIEVLVNVIPVRNNDFEWTTSFNFSTNKNKLLTLSNDLYENTTGYFYRGYTGEPIQTHTHKVEVGGEIGNFHGFKVVDITEEGKWVYEDKYGNHVTKNESSDYVYIDENGNEIDTTFNHDYAEDGLILGNGLPNFYLGWNNTIRYKNFDFTISMRGAFDFQILNFERMYLENPTVLSYNRLQSAFDPVFGKAVLDEPLEFNSYYIEDGDYWKIDNITLGYNFKLDKVKGIASARIYVSSLNTLILTKYKGVDPEIQIDGLEPGNDYRDKYPTTRSFTVGINVNF